jgi:hypothetical protein
MPPYLLRGGGQARHRFVLGRGVIRKDTPPTPWLWVDLSKEKVCERRFWRSIKRKELRAEGGEICDSEGVTGWGYCAARYGDEMEGWSGGVTHKASM